MFSEQANQNDPLNFMRNMWGNMGFSLPGMVTPTFDVEELDKRITDLKAVEGWLRMNLSMLQMTIQGLEMQKSTLTAVKTMSTMAANAHRNMTAGEGEAAAADPAEEQAPLWPWALMKEMQDQLQQQAAQREARAAAAAEAAATQAAAEAAAAAAKKPAAKKPRSNKPV